MTPASCASALAALKVLEKHPELPKKLEHIADYMRAALKAKGVAIRESKTTPIIPIYTYDMLRTFKVNAKLYDRGVYANSTIPPAVAPGECLIRTSLMATHTEPLIDEAVGIIAEVLEEEQ